MSERWNQIIGRRTLLKAAGAVGLLTGLTAIGLGDAPPAAAASPAVAPGAEAPSPVESDPIPQNGWGDIPIVEGEPALEGKVVLPDLLITTAQTRFRPEAIPDARKIDRSAGTILKITPEEADFESAGNRWTGGDLIYTEGILILQDGTVHEFTANDIKKTIFVGQTEFDANPSLVPEVVQGLFRTPATLPLSNDATQATALIGMYSFEGVGGAELGLEQIVDQAWGVVRTKDSPGPELESPLGQLMSRLAFGAEDAFFLDPNGEIFADRVSQGTQISLYGEAHEDGQEGEKTVRLISRVTDGGDDRFLVIEAKGKEVPIGSGVAATTDIQTIIRRVGMTTPEGLVAAYGIDKAQEIAAGVTEIGDAGMLMQQLGGFATEHEQVGVFLAGTESRPRMAKQLSLEPGKKVNYFRVNGEDIEYGAQIISTDTTGKESVEKELAYIYTSRDEGEWVAGSETQQFLKNIFDSSGYAEFMQTGAAQKILQEYATEAKIDVGVVELHAEYAYDQEGVPVMFCMTDLPTTYLNTEITYQIPLMMAEQDESGKWIWSEATRSKLADASGREVGIYAQGWRAKSYPEYEAAITKDANHFSLDDAAMWRVMEPESGTLRDEMEKLKYVANVAAKEEKTISIGNGLLWGVFQHMGMKPEWLDTAANTTEEWLQLVEQHIETFLEPFKDRPELTRVTVANEMLRHAFGLSNYFTDEKKIPRDELLKRSYRKARQILGPNIPLAIRDFLVGFQGNGHADELFDLVGRLNNEEMQATGQKLIDVVEAQAPIGFSAFIDHEKATSPANLASEAGINEMIGALERNRDRYKALGVDFALVEVFIPTNTLPGRNDEERQSLQTYLYSRLFNTGIPISLFDPSNGHEKKDWKYPPPENDQNPYPRGNDYEPLLPYYGIASSLASGIKMRSIGPIQS